MIYLTTQNKLDAALAYASLGWSVFPLHYVFQDGLCSCGNLACGKHTGKHPYALLAPNGFKNAVSLQPTLQSWFKDNPSLNIGIATGKISGIVVLDIDPDKGGDETIEGYFQQHGEPQTVTAKSGGGGRHFYFTYPDGSEIKSGQDVLGPGIDIRADGGYIAAPPNTHLSGNRYEWISGKSPSEIELSALPDWLLTAISKPKVVQSGSAVPVRNQAQTTQKVADIKAALTYLNPDDYDTWIQIGMALKSTGWGQDAFDLWNGWSMQSDKNRPDEMHYKWNSFTPRGIGGITLGTLFYRAKEGGWQPASFDLTDLGNARRLVHHHGFGLRYCYSFKKWYFRDGYGWRMDDDGHVMRMAKETAKRIQQEAKDTTTGEIDEKLSKHCKSSQSKAKLEAMVKLAETELELIVSHENMDTEHMLLGIGNGIVDLTNGKMIQGNPQHMLTMRTSVAWDASAKCPVWEQFLLDIFAGDKSLISYIQRAVGYSLTGLTSEQAFFILYGAGANGKTTFLNTLAALLGEYAKRSAMDTFIVKKNPGVNNDVARLRGARLVTASEAERGKFFAEKLIKELTGDERITARFLFGEFFEFDPIFKIWLGVNHKPYLSADDDAVWRRVHPIPFKVTFPPNKRDKKLQEKLNAELPGILNWAIQGCLIWQHQGLNPPQIIQDCVNEYRAEMDVIGNWISDSCVTGPTHNAGLSTLYSCYKPWADANGYQPVSISTFREKLASKGYLTKRTSQGNMVQDITLVSMAHYASLSVKGSGPDGSLTLKDIINSAFD